MRLLQVLLLIFCSTPLSQAWAIEEGQLAPDFSLLDIYQKQTIQLADYKGKVVYIDFWASWCSPCLLSLPLINELHKQYKDQGFEVLAINLDEYPEDGLDFLNTNPVGYSIPSDPEGKTAELYQIPGMPTSFLVDPQGVVQFVHSGFKKSDLAMIENKLKQMLKLKQ